MPYLLYCPTGSSRNVHLALQSFVLSQTIARPSLELGRIHAHSGTASLFYYYL